MKRIVHITICSAALLTALNAKADTTMTNSQPTNAQLIAELKKEELRTQRLEREMSQLEAERVVYRHEEHRRILRAGPPVPGAARFPSPIHRSAYRPVDEPKFDYEDFFRHPISVTTSPWMGLRSAFDASDLVEQMSTMNEDLRLLQQRKQFEDVLNSEGLTLDRPVLAISGGVEADARWQDGWQGQSGMNLNTAEIDLNAIASQWANAFISLDYDNSPASTGVRQPRGEIFVKRGFVNIGDLDYSPFYLTAGRFYMPFGTYSSNMLTPPLTLSLAQVLQDGALLGFSEGGFYASLYGYSGSMIVSGDDVIDQGGANAGYTTSIGRASLDFGAGVISNIADSQGMQNTGLPPPILGFAFNGFGQPANGPAAPPQSAVPNFDNLAHRVAGLNGHGKIGFGPFSLMAEYAGAAEKFNPADMTFNGAAAQPQSFDVEGDFSFHIYDKPSTLGVAWGETWDSFALNLPRDSLQAEFSISLWKDTVEEIEYRHDDNYGAGTVATGGTIPPGASFPITPVPVPVSTGGSRDMILGQVGVYF